MNLKIKYVINNCCSKLAENLGDLLFEIECSKKEDLYKSKIENDFLSEEIDEIVKTLRVDLLQKILPSTNSDKKKDHTITI